MHTSLDIQSLMKENEQQSFLNMIKLNKFQKFRFLPSSKLEFDMNYEDPTVWKRTYRNDLYLVILHNDKNFAGSNFKRPVLSIVRVT